MAARHADLLRRCSCAMRALACHMSLSTTHPSLPSLQTQLEHFVAHTFFGVSVHRAGAFSSSFIVVFIVVSAIANAVRGPGDIVFCSCLCELLWRAMRLPAQPRTMVSPPAFWSSTTTTVPVPARVHVPAGWSRAAAVTRRLVVVALSFLREHNFVTVERMQRRRKRQPTTADQSSSTASQADQQPVVAAAAAVTARASTAAMTTTATTATSEVVMEDNYKPTRLGTATLHSAMGCTQVSIANSQRIVCLCVCGVRV
jgi:hypothetical protein